MSSIIEEIFRFLGDLAVSPVWEKLLRTVVAIVLLYLVYRLVKKWTHLATKRLKPNTTTLVYTVLRYGFFVVGIMYVLGIFGINLNALLGAAGIAGITIGFAAQTSVSNIISGFFLLSEKVFKIGDYIDVEGTAGTVESVDILSVKLKTIDGQLVRIPNEAIIKASAINYSYYPLRRISFRIRVSYDTDLQTALDVLGAVPATIPLILLDPPPLLYIDTFDESAVILCLAVWMDRNNRWAVQTATAIAVKNAFDTAGIEIALPQVHIHQK
jgi:small-conductance mechanosensitive channel